MRAGSSRDFLFEAREPALPMTAIGLALAALLVADARQQKLIGIELVAGLGDALALLLQQFGQRFRFRLAALCKIDLHFRQALVGDRFQASARGRRCRCSTSAWMRATAIAGAGAGVAQRLLELVERPLLAALAERPSAACGRARPRSRSP